MIRAYQISVNGQPGPWLAGMTLDPAEVSEAWCHQRGYVCLIEELHRKRVRAGDSFGAAYVVGYFDDIIIVPLGIVLAVKLIPPDLMSEHRRLAAAAQDRPISRTAAILIAVVWAVCFGFVSWLCYRFFVR